MSRPALANNRNSKRTALRISPSALLVSIRSSGTILGTTASNFSAMAQTPFQVAAHAAAKILTVGIEPRQQLAHARRLDHRNRAIARFLRASGVELDGEVQSLAGIGVDHGDQRWISDMEEVLIKRHLRRIAWEHLGQAITLHRAEVLGIERLVLPQTRNIELDTGAGRNAKDDAVGMARH